MGVEKRSKERRPIRGIVISRYCLKSKKQKCLKSGYKAIRRWQQDRTKKKNKGYENPKKIKNRILGQ